MTEHFTRSTVSNPADVKKFLAKSCPKCGAEVGENCMYGNFRRLHISQTHVERYRARRNAAPEITTPKPVQQSILSRACEVAARATDNRILKSHLLMAAEKLR